MGSNPSQVKDFSLFIGVNLWFPFQGRMAISFPEAAFLLVSTKDARHFDPADLKCARALGTRLGRMTREHKLQLDTAQEKPAPPRVYGRGKFNRVSSHFIALSHTLLKFLLSLQECYAVFHIVYSTTLHSKKTKNKTKQKNQHHWKVLLNLAIIWMITRNNYIHRAVFN